MPIRLGHVTCAQEWLDIVHTNIVVYSIFYKLI